MSLSLDNAIKEAIVTTLRAELQPLISETLNQMLSAHRGDSADADELITPKELARRTGQPEITWAMRRMEGRGPKYLKIGRNVRYRWSDVQAWMQEHSALVNRRGRPPVKEVQTNGAFHGRGRRAAVTVAEVTL